MTNRAWWSGFPYLYRRHRQRARRRHGVHRRTHCASRRIYQDYDLYPTRSAQLHTTHISSCPWEPIGTQMHSNLRSIQNHDCVVEWFKNTIGIL